MVGRGFILAGRAIFTVSNGKGEHYTYLVTHKAGTLKHAPAWFVSVLTGPDNDDDDSYAYLGRLDAETGHVSLTRASRLTDDATAVRVVRWAIRLIWINTELPVGYAVTHCGYCGRCGRLLTTPKSVESGFGPECTRRMKQVVEPIYG